jgi:hypothetical protein
MDELVRYYDYVWEKDRDKSDFFESASKNPDGLQKKLSFAHHKVVFRKVESVREAVEAALQEIGFTPMPEILTPGDYLTRSDTHCAGTADLALTFKLLVLQYLQF